MIGPEGGDCVPFFANYGVSTIILASGFGSTGAASSLIPPTFVLEASPRHHPGTLAGLAPEANRWLVLTQV